MLPTPDLGNLHEVENHMRAANSTPGGREALAKFILAHKYIPLLIPLVDMAEDLESVSDLHRLCSIMKMLILLNDTSIIEYVVHDDVILGVVGALECESNAQTIYAVSNTFQMTPTFLYTKQIIGSTSPMNRSSRRW
jgi:hypothetical protein